MPRLFDIDQRSDEWFSLRRGVITGTRAKDLFTQGQSNTKAGVGHSASFLKKRDEAIAEIAMERLDHSGKPQPTGAALRRGNEYEPEALDAYTFETGLTVDACGFALSDESERWGCSPDGLVGEDGMIQAKVPTSVLKHVEYIQTGIQADEYGWQCFHEMFVMDRKWSDIVSYCPEAKPSLQLAIHRLYAPRDGWKAYRAKLVAADNEIDDLVEVLGSIRRVA